MASGEKKVVATPITRLNETRTTDKLSANVDFDVQAFNKDFEIYLDAKQRATEKKEAGDLEKLNKIVIKKRLDQLTLAEILINFKNSLFGLLDDLLAFKYEITTFTKDDRLFYLGLFIVAFMIFIYVAQLLFGDDPKKPPDQLVEVQIHFDKDNKVKSATKRLSNAFVPLTPYLHANKKK